MAWKCACFMNRGVWVEWGRRVRAASGTESLGTPFLLSPPRAHSDRPVPSVAQPHLGQRAEHVRAPFRRRRLPRHGVQIRVGLRREDDDVPLGELPSPARRVRPLARGAARAAELEPSARSACDDHLREEGGVVVVWEVLLHQRVEVRDAADDGQLRGEAAGGRALRRRFAGRGLSARRAG
eukprot:75606-Prymnesium_polylepis.1